MNFRLPNDLTKAIEAAVAHEKARNGETNRSVVMPPEPQSEAFWVKVEDVRHEPAALHFVGRVASNLVYTNSHGLNFDSILEFEDRHVLACGFVPPAGAAAALPWRK